MFKRILLIFLLTCASTLALGGGVLYYARYIEPQWIEETRHQVICPDWKGRPVRLALLSDLHAKSGDGDYMDAIVRKTLAARPDAILLLGDYMNEPRLGDTMAPETLAHHLAPLVQSGIPCLAVLGNHDYNQGESRVQNMLRSIGVRMMEGGQYELNADGHTLFIFGMRCLCHFDSPGTVATPPPGVASVLMTHSPAGARFAPAGTSLAVSGHTHGGQVCLPGGKPIIKPDRRVTWQEMKGSHHNGRTQVYVTRGLGTSELPLRLFCRPELTVVAFSNE